VLIRNYRKDITLTNNKRYKIEVICIENIYPLLPGLPSLWLQSMVSGLGVGISEKGTKNPTPTANRIQ